MKTTVTAESLTELLTKGQAAQALGIKNRTLDDWRAAGTLPCIQRGRYIRFLRSDIEGFLRAHRVEGKPRPAFRRRLSSSGADAA